MIKYVLLFKVDERLNRVQSYNFFPIYANKNANLL